MRESSFHNEGTENRSAADKISRTCYSWHAARNLPSLKNDGGCVKYEFHKLCKNIEDRAVHPFTEVIHLMELTIRTST